MSVRVTHPANTPPENWIILLWDTKRHSPRIVKSKGERNIVNCHADLAPRALAGEYHYAWKSKDTPVWICGHRDGSEFRFDCSPRETQYLDSIYPSEKS